MPEVGQDMEPEVPQNAQVLTWGRTKLAGGCLTPGVSKTSIKHLFHLISNKCVFAFYTYTIILNISLISYFKHKTKMFSPLPIVLLTSHWENTSVG